MDSIDGYFDIPWTDVDIEKINNELLDFQNKCRKLPKALKEWQAFNDLKKKIDDFNETCPLLERMLDNAMKERHWKRIEEVTGYKFEVESEGFALRHVMEAPLLKHMEDIEVSESQYLWVDHLVKVHSWTCVCYGFILLGTRRTGLADLGTVYNYKLLYI